MTSLLEVKNLSRHFGGLKAVDDIDFNVQEGKIKAVIGPNGAGKTTLFHLISGYLPSTSGRVLFDGKEIQDLKPHQIASNGIGRTFQHIRLFHGMTALENVMVGRHTRSSSGFIQGMLSTPYARREEHAIRERSLEIMDMLGISDIAETDALSLSFGEQRAVELSRALALEPRLLLLDEPAAGLNMHETAAMGELILKIRELGITVLIVEHDMSLVMNISDEIMVLSYGEKIAEGSPLDIQKNEEVVRVYLGDDDA
jgi:branched-chain amino acid transport system ATP-binding protein